MHSRTSNQPVWSEGTGLWEEGLRDDYIIEASGLKEGHQQRQPRAGGGLPHAQPDTLAEGPESGDLSLDPPSSSTRRPLSILEIQASLSPTPTRTFSQLSHAPHALPLPLFLGGHAQPPGQPSNSVNNQTFDSRPKELVQMTLQAWTQIIFTKRLKGTRGQCYNLSETEAGQVVSSSESRRDERCSRGHGAFLFGLHLLSTYCVLGPLLGTGEAGGMLKQNQGGFSSR